MYQTKLNLGELPTTAMFRLSLENPDLSGHFEEEIFHIVFAARAARRRKMFGKIFGVMVMIGLVIFVWLFFRGWQIESGKASPPTPVPTATWTPVPTQYWNGILKTDANFYIAPGSQSDGSLAKDTVVMVSGRTADYQWLFARLPNGTERWLEASSVTVQKPVSELPLAAPAPTATNTPTATWTPVPLSPTATATAIPVTPTATAIGVSPLPSPTVLTVTLTVTPTVTPAVPAATAIITATPVLTATATVTVTVTPTATVTPDP